MMLIKIVFPIFVLISSLIIYGVLSSKKDNENIFNFKAKKHTGNSKTQAPFRIFSDINIIEKYITEAEVQIAYESYKEARKLVMKALKLEPENEKAIKLLEQINSKQ